VNIFHTEIQENRSVFRNANRHLVWKTLRKDSLERTRIRREDNINKCHQGWVVHYRCFLLKLSIFVRRRLPYMEGSYEYIEYEIADSR
jgi:hypothetical protein